MLISVTSTDLLLPINYIYLNLSLALLIEHVFSFSIKPLVWKWKEKTTFFVHSLLSVVTLYNIRITVFEIYTNLLI